MILKWISKKLFYHLSQSLQKVGEYLQQFWFFKWLFFLIARPVRLLQNSFRFFRGHCFFRFQFSYFFPIKALKRHSYTVAQSGSGKSELMKVLIYYLQCISAKKKNKSIVLIEPHGDLALEVLSFALNEQMERVVYIDPYIRDTSKQAVGHFLFDEDYTPVINPFQIKDKSDRSIDFVSQELTGAFVEVLKDKNFSIQMDALLKPCIATLLRKGDATLRDLQRFMNDNENADLIQLGLQSPKETDRAFFQHGFQKKSLALTKSSIYFKTQSLLNSYTFSNLVLGKNTIDLEAALNSGKVIIFNLAKGRMGKKVSPVFGKLVIALIQGIALKRQDIPDKFRKPTFVFVDEFQNYVTESIEDILAESRKYALHLNLSHQLIGQKMNAKMKDIILGNTALKIV